MTAPMSAAQGKHEARGGVIEPESDTHLQQSNIEPSRSRQLRYLHDCDTCR